MIKRSIEKEFFLLLKEYPIVTILGPRQAGKTTLARELLKDYSYVNLEVPEVREFAMEDPKAFLEQYKTRVIIDEIQRVPHLLSYLQVIVDENNDNGQFVITGSHQLALTEAISQSLAGRTAILKLLPFSISELNGGPNDSLNFMDYCYKGFLPRVYDKNLRPSRAYSNYYQTYVERDVRQLINLKNLALFEKFLKLLAGRVGQIFKSESLSNEIGVNGKTIKSWLSILEASFIIFKLPPYFENFGKRAIKSPKYYFTDVGLLSFLLGIERSEQIGRDPLVGNIFENLIVIECLKEQYNKGKMANLYFFRDHNNFEIDVLYQNGRDLVAIEIKSAMTFSQSQLKGLKKFQDKNQKCYLVYNGESKILSNGIELLHFTEVNKIFSQ